MRILGLVLGIAAALAAIWYLSRDLLPPDRLRFAAGGAGGGYHGIAKQYQAILAEDGIDVEILTTAGSVENARLLAAGEADVGLLQGGVPVDGDVHTLGNLFMEPFFIFTRRDGAMPGNVAAWSGLRLAVGGEGSGTRAAFLSMAGAAGLDPTANTLLPVGGTDGAQALLAGDADAALFVAPLKAPYLAALFDEPNAQLLTLEYLPALTSRLPGSRRIVLPAGGMVMNPPVPAQDTPMLAMVARMGTQPDLHPALTNRLIAAARRLHAGQTPINIEGTFPNMDFGALPANAYARDLIRNGPSPLHRYLPYWIVAQINRVLILLLPIIFLLLPVIRILPGLYAWRMRTKVFTYYQNIRDIETEADAATDADALRGLDDRLTEIDNQIAKLRLPIPYRHLAYTARVHVDLLRRRIATKMGQ